MAWYQAKGPCVLLSRAMVGDVLAPDGWASRSLHQITASVHANDAAVVHSDAYPQDDAWLGMAISTSVPPMRSRSHRPLYALHAGSVVYAEGYIDRAYPLHSTTLIWHNGHALNKLDAGRPNVSGLAHRIETLHKLMANTSTRCYTPNVTLNCAAPFESCAGAEWRRCLVVHNYGACARVRLTTWG